MTIKNKIQKELEELLNDSISILRQLKNPEIVDDSITLKFDYQEFYTKALRIVKLLASDRYIEFKSYYEISPKRNVLHSDNYVIQDFLNGANTNNRRFPEFDINDKLASLVFNQCTILESLTSRIDSVLADIENTLFAELQDEELETAKQLMKINLRASGALCGVIIENHLQKTCKSKSITVKKKNPGISDLNELLKQNKIYDTSSWRKISYLADLRNICSHKKDIEPTKEQIVELINGTNWLIKNIN